MMISSRFNQAILALVTVGILGCSSESQDWDAAQETATVEAYANYLASHANGKHAKEASKLRDKLIDDAAWNEARQGNSVAAFDAYLQAHSNGSHAQEAQVRRIGLEHQYIRILMSLSPPEGTFITNPWLGAIESYPDGTKLNVTLKSRIAGEEIETRMEATYAGMDSDHGKFMAADGACLLLGPTMATVKPCPDWKPFLPNADDQSAVLQYTWAVDYF